MDKVIERFLESGILISPEVDVREIGPVSSGPIVLDKESYVLLTAGKTEDWLEYEKAKVKSQKTEIKPHHDNGNVQLLETYEETNVKISIKDFVSLYNGRYTLLQNILRQRQELSHASSIKKAGELEPDEETAFIGMILDIGITKNGNIMLTFEDPTGIIKAVVTKNDKNLFDLAKEMSNDLVVGVQGTKGNGIVFVKNLILPDVPLTKELKKSPIDEAALFISDIHIGSKDFMQKNFERFIEWLKGNLGNQKHKEMVKKVKYLFVIGDIVDGIGIYPEQDKDLNIKDIYEQYAVFEKYLQELSPDLNIIICPGNHDSLRVAEPQPVVPAEVLPQLSVRKNTFMVSSPSIIKIGQVGSFPGFDMLLYHGFSFPFYADAIESIRAKGGLENTDNIMTYLMKARHLAPTHGSTQYQLGYEKDPLVIRTVPDFFVTGHIHRAAIKSYRNITMLNCSCWIAQTEYQEKRGLVPQPCRAIYVNLHTRESKILNFEHEDGSQS
ncbi:MAG: hypothetical protein HGA85_00730 [Nanoarchaeota archaeon]|nr:hypothetical protein [Nanoarchaeota archaeon]